MTNPLQKLLKILLLGDSCYDYYHYGEVNRISPEAPIPIFDLKDTKIKLGMAANVNANLLALGATVSFHTCVSEKKHRYIDRKTKQQLLRVDENIEKEDSKKINHHLIDYGLYDAVVISDYDKGFISYNDLYKIECNFDGPIFIDTKKTSMSEFSDMIVKINEHEYKKAGSNICDVENLIVTYGGEKVIWNKPYPDAAQVFFPPKVEAYDVCGAGDTFFAALVFEYLRSDSMESAITFAMKAAAITVKHIGVYAPTLEEIEND